jgi:hypothetical protein
MPDEHYPTFPRRDPERIFQAAIQTDLEFVIERIERLPTRKELARAALGIIFSTAIITTLLGWWFLAR